MNAPLLNLMTEGGQAERKVLRPHQVRAIDMLKGEMRAGKKRVVIAAPTGFGKTVLASTIVRGALAKGGKALFTVPAISLIDQTVAAFEAEGIEHIGVMQGNHQRTDPTAPVQIASVQTLQNRKVPEFNVCLVDECHLMYKAVLSMLGSQTDLHFVGLSATPWAKGMGLYWQSLLVPARLQELIDGGYLSKFTTYAPHIPDLTKVRTRAGEYVEADAAEVMSQSAVVGDVVSNWLEHGENRPTMCFCVNRAHAKMVAERFANAGVAVDYVDGFTDVVEREIIADRFRSGETSIVVSVRTLTTGVDWPVSCIIDAAPTQSEMLYVQKIGRGLRVNPGTEDLVIFDHASNALRLGLVTDVHHDALDDSEPGEKSSYTPRPDRLPVPCKACNTAFIGLACPVCGEPRRLAANVPQAEGALKKLSGENLPPTMEEKQRFYSMCIWVCNERGYKPGWAGNKYREKFSVWPRGLVWEPLAPDQAFWNWEKSRRIAWAKAQAKLNGTEG